VPFYHHVPTDEGRAGLVGPSRLTFPGRAVFAR
jgi:hypothetical protein